MLPLRLPALRSPGTIFCAAALLLTGCSHSASYYVQRGQDLYRKAQYADAELNFKKAIQRDPDSAEAFDDLGLTLQQEGKRREAFEAISGSLTKAPSRQLTRIHLANFLLSEYLANPKRPADVYNRIRNLLSDVMTRDTRCFDCFRIQGWIQLSDRRPDEALASFRAANDIHPLQNEVMRGLAIALGRNNQPDEAEKQALSLIAHDKTYGPIYDDLYNAYQASHRAVDAERILKLKVTNNPDTPGYRLQLASYFAQANKNRRNGNNTAAFAPGPADFSRCLA